MNRQRQGLTLLLCLGCFVGLRCVVNGTIPHEEDKEAALPPSAVPGPEPCSGCHVLNSGPITQINGCIPNQPVYQTSCSGRCYPTTTRQMSVQLSCPGELPRYRYPYTMTATCDNHMNVYFDGVLQGSPARLSTNWPQSATFTVPSNTGYIGIQCNDFGVVGGILASFSNGMVTDHTWQCSPLAGRTWRMPRSPAYEIGPHGRAPWHAIGGISSNAKWIWTHGWRGQDRIVYCIKTIEPVVSTRWHTYSVIDRCGCQG